MRSSLAFLLAASTLAACQAFTGTGDLEVREAGSTSGSGASSSAASAAGGEGGSGGEGGTGQAVSAGSSMSSMTQAASSGTGGCATCGSTFESGGNPDAICDDMEHFKYMELQACICGTPATAGSCYDAENASKGACVGFCSTMGGGQAPDQGCKDCAATAIGCADAYQACMNG
jgi:hypothetical protein